MTENASKRIEETRKRNHFGDAASESGKRFQEMGCAVVEPQRRIGVGIAWLGSGKRCSGEYSGLGMCQFRLARTNSSLVPRERERNRVSSLEGFARSDKAGWMQAPKPLPQFLCPLSSPIKGRRFEECQEGS